MAVRSALGWIQREWVTVAKMMIHHVVRNTRRSGSWKRMWSTVENRAVDRAVHVMAHWMVVLLVNGRHTVRRRDTVEHHPIRVAGIVTSGVDGMGTGMGIAVARRRECRNGTARNGTRNRTTNTVPVVHHHILLLWVGGLRWVAILGLWFLKVRQIKIAHF